MINSAFSKNFRNSKRLFNPYENGICSYDLAFLSSKRALRKNLKLLKTDQYHDLTAWYLNQCIKERN